MTLTQEGVMYGSRRLSDKEVKKKDTTLLVHLRILSHPSKEGGMNKIRGGMYLFTCHILKHLLFKRPPR
jgi:hypothetical protein